MKRFYIIRVNENDADTYASEHSVADALDHAMLDPTDSAEWACVYARDAGAARLKTPKWKPLPAGAR